MFLYVRNVIEGEPICLREGVTTGLSLHAILKLSVVVAFDAENLKPVAIDLRPKYPNSRIIIAADNDCKNMDLLYNTGVEKTNEVSEDIENAIRIYPQWTDAKNNLIHQSVNWNDIYQEYGDEVDLIRKKIETALNVNIECIKFYTHETRLSKENKIYMKGE